MPVIKPRTRGKQMMRHLTRFDRENTESLYAYAQFIGEPTEYVLNQLVETVLAKDKEFLAWRATHPESYGPQSPSVATAVSGRDARGDRREGSGVTPMPVTV